MQLLLAHKQSAFTLLDQSTSIVSTSSKVRENYGEPTLLLKGQRASRVFSGIETLTLIGCWRGLPLVCKLF